MSNAFFKFARVLGIGCLIIPILGAAPDATLTAPAAGSVYDLYSTFNVTANVDTDPAIAVVANKPMGMGGLYVNNPGGGGTQWMVGIGVKKGVISSTARPFCYWLPGAADVGGLCQTMMPPVVTTDAVQCQFNFPSSFPMPPMP